MAKPTVFAVISILLGVCNLYARLSPTDASVERRTRYLWEAAEETIGWSRLAVGEQLGTDDAAAIYADTCLIPAGSPSEVAVRIHRLRLNAGHRSVRFGIDVRPIIGVDESAVQALSRRIIRVAPAWTFGENASSQVQRRRVLAAMTRADSAASPFVGTVETIAQRLYEYCAPGVDVFHLHGFDPLADAGTHAAVIDAVRRLTDAETHRSADVQHVA